MKTLIVDDEPIARQVLREALGAFAAVSIIGEAENGRQALEQIKELHPDLVFLDLQMPVMGGFEVVRSLSGRRRMPVVVIVTAFDEHAIKRMGERKVSEDEVLDVLRNPTQTGLPTDPGRFRYRKHSGPRNWVDVIFEEDPTQIVVFSVWRK